MNSSQHENDRYSIVMADAALKPEWREHFEIFKRYGRPNSPEARAALKAAFKARPYKKRFSQGFLGYFLGPLYFLLLGMWKRALTLISIGVGMVFLMGLIQGISPGRLLLPMLMLSLSLASLAVFWIGFMLIPLLILPFEPNWGYTFLDVAGIWNMRLFLIIMTCTSMSQVTVNYSYYLKQVKGDNGWNPFNGTMRWWDWLLIPLPFVMVVVMVLWMPSLSRL